MSNRIFGIIVLLILASTAAIHAQTCSGMSLGNAANLNGFVPFPSTDAWNTNIATAPVDPNSAAITSAGGFAGLHLHVNFGSQTDDGGIPYVVVDSTQTPSAWINVIDYAGQSDVVVAPFPANAPIEGAPTDCSGWPDTYQGDAHSLVLDRAKCYLYETFNTNRCNGLYNASSETIWNMSNTNPIESRPWGWTSADAAGLAVFPGLIRYDEVAAGAIHHAIRFSMQQTKDDANSGYFVEPASHAAGTNWGVSNVMGMRIRLKANFDISGFSPTNQIILTAMKQYGMILADNGGYFYFMGDTDPRWDDNDLSNLNSVGSENFEVVQMTPEFPGWDSSTAPSGNAPTINSFIASAASVTIGSPVTFTYSASGDSYDYIDMIGPVTAGGGSVTVNPTATQTYTLYSTNAYGQTVSTPITVSVPGSVVAPPVFTPPAGTFNGVASVTISTPTSPYAAIYYTTDGSAPTYPITGTTLAYPVTPTPPNNQGTVNSITVSASETLKAIAVVSGYPSPSTVATAAYNIPPTAATPVFTPKPGTFTAVPTVSISDSTTGAAIYYTTDGTTPVYPVSGTTALYTAPFTLSNVSGTQTVNAIAVASGYLQSAEASAAYTLNLPTVAMPTFSPAAGQYNSAQTVTINSASGATIYFTTDGTTPTYPITGTTLQYTGAITVSASQTVEAIGILSGEVQSPVGVAAYTIGTMTAPECSAISLGDNASLNGFLPFPATNAWNTNIVSAPVDPNSEAITSVPGFAGLHLHHDFGSTATGYGIPFVVVDSTQTPAVPINVIDYANQSDVVVAPYPANTPIEGFAADCSGWPDTYQGDAHALVIDRTKCELYETFNTNRCNGLYNASGETIWDLKSGESRPYGWTSADAAGLAIFPGLIRYDEVASGAIHHAIRFTMEHTKNDANGGYFVLPATHGAGTDWGVSNVMGMRIRLKADFDISGFSPANQVILTAMQQYGMILADNGGYFFFQGAPDPRWDDNDLSNLDSIGSENFEVVQMTPEFPGWDSATAPTGNAPVINSFTASATSVPFGSPVTFSYHVTGDSYDYIDMIGPVTAGSGSVTINPTATQTYTLYSMNQYGDNGSGIGYGESVSTPITVTVPGSVVAPPVFAPPSGQYTGQMLVTLTTPTSPYAAIYYTTDGSTPTYPITGTTKAYPVTPTPPNNPGNLLSIAVTPTQTVKAIAVVSGYAAPSAVTSATYTAASATVSAPIFSLNSGTYNSAQTLTISDSTSGAAIYYTTDGSTPTYPVTGTTTLYTTTITVATTETVNAIAVATSYANSPMTSAGYNIVPPQAATPTFNPPSGSYVGTQSVSISDATSGATIYYTTDGTKPTTSSSVYKSQIVVSTSETLRAIATASGDADSTVASASYSIATATPTFSPAAGDYGQAQTVTISDLTPNATIYYTTNGTTPTTSSSVYHSAITVSATETLEAIATSSGYIQSSVGLAAYTITPAAQAATPTFNPVAGSYIGTQTVTISDTSLGTTIYYTLTPGTIGTTPTSSSTVYTGPITVSGTSVLEAIAVGGGFTASSAASAAYAIISPPAFVQQCYNNAGGSATMKCTLNGVKAGDALVIGTYSAPLKSVASSTTTQPVSVISNFATTEGVADFNVYLLPNASAGSITITATANNGASANAIVVDEYTNVAASPLDASAIGSCKGYCTTVSSSNFTTTAAADMLWSMCNADQSTLTAGTVPIAWTAVLPQGNGGVDSGYVNFFAEAGAAGVAGTYYGECSNAYISSIATIALKPHPPVVTPNVNVTPAPSSITTAQALSVTVAVSGPSGDPMPTGSVTLTSGTYASSPVTLSNGSATFNVPAGSLAAGIDSLTAAYTPDASSATTFSSASGSQSVTVTAANTNPTTLSATSVSFGNVAINEKSAIKYVTLKNNQAVSLAIATLAVSGSGFALDSSTTCKSTLAAGATCTISLTLTPASTGAQTGSLLITTNASNSPQTVALSGTGVIPTALLPAAVAFGNVVENTASAAKTVYLYNYQTTTLTISSITAPANYAVSGGTCGTTLAAGSYCTIQITLTPTALGALPAGSLTVATNAANSPLTAALSGTGMK
ncbi:MAG: chitobiase/beta-hexosaminidase C-terminal domain-containing protein [Terracidiphilus sp.]